MSKVFEIKYLGNKNLIPESGKEYTIGRDVSNDIILPDSTVSRKHAMITFNGRDCTIKDLNSTNGIFVNDNKVAQKKLENRDLITVGSIPITVVTKEEIFKNFKKNRETTYDARSEDSIIIQKKFVQLIQEIDDEDSKLAQKIKEIESTVNENRKKLKTAATIDPLTGIYNRGYFDKFIKNEILRDARYGHKFSLLIADIDFFKKINDKFGHQQGDKILKWISTQLKFMIRQTDVVARYGGEEFVVVLVETGIDEAKKVAEKIREKISVASQFELIQPITISIGVAGFPDNGSTDKDVLQAADMALYQSKQNGRNCVTIYNLTK